MTHLDDVLALADLPERRVAICLAGKLVGELFDLQDQLADLPPAVSLDGTGRAELEAQIADVRARMRERTAVFTLRAMPGRDWGMFWARLPVRKVADPAKGEVGETDEEWDARQAPFNAELVARTVVDPPMSVEGAERLWGAIHFAAWQELTGECMVINRAKVDVPNSAAASNATRSSEPS